MKKLLVIIFIGIGAANGQVYSNPLKGKADTIRFNPFAKLTNENIVTHFPDGELYIEFLDWVADNYTYFRVQKQRGQDTGWGYVHKWKNKRRYHFPTSKEMFIEWYNEKYGCYLE